MTDKKTIDLVDLDLLAIYARSIAMLPLEDWLEVINRDETVGPIMDPTRWRESSEKMQDTKRLIEAAMPLKQFVLSVQTKTTR